MSHSDLVGLSEISRENRVLRDLVAIYRHLSGRLLQIDEPFLAGYPEDVELAVEAVNIVGVTGAQLDPGMLRRRATAVRVSVAGLVVPLGLGVAAGYVMPAALLSGRADRSVFAVFLGVAMCVSAIPVIAKTLADMKLLHRDVGQLTLVVGMVDDVAGGSCSRSSPRWLPPG